MLKKAVDVNKLALRGLLGKGAPLSASSIARLREKWIVEYNAWRHRRLDDRELVYAWADSRLSIARRRRDGPGQGGGAVRFDDPRIANAPRMSYLGNLRLCLFPDELRFFDGLVSKSAPVPI